MKIIITNLYFGKCPGYFDLFLRSCAMNPTIDFLFLVDFEVPFDLPSNIRFIKISFEEIRSRFQGGFDFPIALESPYKLTDFQPAYGELLADYFEGYDWWGHCDFDMLFGDLNQVIDVVRQAQYVKIFRRGHLTLYKNSADINSVYKMGIAPLNYRDIFSSDKFFNFDETNGIDKIFTAMELPVFREELIADINPKSPFLYMTAHSNLWGQYFLWSHGKLLCKSQKNADREFLYIHFQKRLMAEKYKPLGENSTDILINQFGLFDYSAGLNDWIFKVLCLIPNIPQLKRFYTPRFYKVVKRKLY
jgi:hypothetical protein